MYRHIINLLDNKNLCIKLVNYYDYTEMHGQQNIKICINHIRDYLPNRLLKVL